MNRSGKKRLILPITAFLLITLTGLAIFLYVNRILDSPLEVKDINIDSRAALKLNVLEQVSKRNGVTEWKLKASSATLMKKEDKAVLTDVNVVFYTENNTIVVLTSDRAVLNTKTQDITFLDNVVVRYETYTLRTDKLHYEKKPHIIHSNAHVTLEDKDSVIESDSMVTELKKNKTILKGHVKGRFSENFNIP